MASMPPPPPPYGQPPYNPYDPNARRAQKDAVRMQREAMRQQERNFRYQARMQRDQNRLRTSSVLGPLLLIGLGILFLLITTHRLQIYSLGVALSPWWPMVLVLAGVIRLAEWAWDRHRMAQWQPGDPPVPRTSLGGGVTTLLVLICLALAAVHFSTHLNQNERSALFSNINPDNIDEFMGDKHESTQTLDETLPTGAVLTVTNPRGDVTVTGTSPDQQMHVTLSREVYSFSDSDAGKKAQELGAKVQTNGTAVTLAVPSVDGSRVTVALTLPASTTLNATVNRGDLTVSGLHASVNLTANHGDVAVDGIDGTVSTHLNRSDSDLNAHDIRGSLSLEGKAQDLTVSNLSGTLSLRGEFFGETRLEHIGGGLRFHTSRTDLQVGQLPGEVEISNDDHLSVTEGAGPVVLTTHSRNITFERISGDISVTNRNGSVDITSASPAGNIIVQNKNGEVNLTLPESGFTVDADTQNGSIENDFNLPTTSLKNHSAVTGTVGKGGPSVHVVTSESDIRLHKTIAMPLPPMPPSTPPPALSPTPPSTPPPGFTTHPTTPKKPTKPASTSNTF